jgi:hypothetical protein
MFKITTVVLVVDIDIVLNECFENCTRQIEEIIEHLDLKSKLESA